MTTPIALNLRRVLEPLAARVVRVRAAGADPLTGHRGAADATVVVAEAGPCVLFAQLAREASGLVLRGQACAAENDAGALLGAMVHVRAESGPARLAPLDATGTFVIRGLEGRPVAVDLELDAGAFRLAWPVDDGDDR